MLNHVKVLAQSGLVKNFYNGKSVLITGGTGSLGKIILEKLLRSCRGLENVYLLIRPKKGQLPEHRITEMLSVPLYDKLKEVNPDALRKIVMIEGDLIRPNLGLSDSSKKVLMDKISVVFHCAASVSFDLSIEEAVTVNFTGTRELVQLCKKMPKMEAFVHVSTFFSNYPESSIEERIYPLRSGLDGAIDYNNLNAKEIVRKIPGEWFKLWPNTYTISKALVENYLDQEKDSLPISIVRPSIILSTLREPFPSWIDNFYGATVVVANSGKGILRTMWVNINMKAHVVPSDVVSNMIICVASKTKEESLHNIKVYNCCSGGSNPMKWRQFCALYNHYNKVYPADDVIWYPESKLFSSYLTYRFFYIMQHYILGYIMDLSIKIRGGKARLVKIHNSIHKIIMKISPFSINEWSVYDDNSRNLIKKLSKEDKEIFPFDVKQINWDDYCRDYVKGIKLYLFKESFDNIDVARARVKKFYWIEKSLQCSTIGIITYFIYYFF